MEAVAGLTGVALGAVLSWFVSTVLERRRDNRRLGGVVGLLAAELENNRDRIEEHRGQATPKWSDLLTLGDWDANKAAFSQLMRDESLWREVVTTYGRIYDAISRQRDPPSPEELGAISEQLFADREKLIRK